jgi:hypothetical protein
MLRHSSSGSLCCSTLVDFSVEDEYELGIRVYVLSVLYILNENTVKDVSVLKLDCGYFSSCNIAQYIT